MVAVVIPAHDEERSLPRLLDALAGVDAEVVVVANGCRDGTAEVARSRGVAVVETPVASKTRALALGDAAVSSFPRLYVDADVVLGPADVAALARAVARPGVHAAGPARVLPMDGVARVVRMYYAVWQEVPSVRDELFGRGAVALDEPGHTRVAAWPDVMSDDLYVARSFAPAERVVVPEARAVIRPPRTYRDLLRRRTRAMAGNRSTAQRVPAPGTSGATVLAHLGSLVLARPGLAPAVAVFVVTAVLARVRGALLARRRVVPWLRDESSRAD